MTTKDFRNAKSDLKFSMELLDQISAQQSPEMPLEEAEQIDETEKVMSPEVPRETEEEDETEEVAEEVEEKVEEDVEEYEMDKTEAIEEHENLVKVLREGSREELLAEAEKQEEELEEIKNEE